MRGCAAPCKACQARSTSPVQARASPAIIGRRTEAAILLHGFKIAIGGDRKSGLDHVYPKAVKLLGQAQLLLHIHTAARRLFAVTKRSVENSDARPIHVIASLRNNCFSYFIGGLPIKEKIIIFTVTLVMMIVLENLMNVALFKEQQVPGCPASVLPV